MVDAPDRGDHDFTDKFNAEQVVEDGRSLRRAARPSTGALVIDAEHAAVGRRREHIKNPTNDAGERPACGIKVRDRTRSLLTGLALSGGGIRSASFALGALQGLDATRGIEGIDYLSTVSGGGYVGCALTTALQKTGGEFPFVHQDAYDDTVSVRHIRDYSNYLIPHGFLDVITALGIIGRGL